MPRYYKVVGLNFAWRTFTHSNGGGGGQVWNEFAPMKNKQLVGGGSDQAEQNWDCVIWTVQFSTQLCPCNTSQHRWKQAWCTTPLWTFICHLSCVAHLHFPHLISGSSGTHSSEGQLQILSLLYNKVYNLSHQPPHPVITIVFCPTQGQHHFCGVKLSWHQTLDSLAWAVTWCRPVKCRSNIVFSYLEFLWHVEDASYSPPSIAHLGGWCPGTK